MPPLILILLLAAPVVGLLLLRVNAAFVFLALCLGAVLVRFSGADAVNIVAGASLHATATASTIRLILLLAPAALTVLFMIRTVSDKQRLFNVLPALGVGLLTSLLVVPLLPPAAAHSLMSSDLWRQIQTFQSGIVALSTLVCLAFLWLLRPKHVGKKSKRHKE